ncbi:MAG TPA: ABC transporter ATP-binding protein [Candidatus Onthousia faecigallinarum]|nr:ABC transporter ATP-binding protein [Candidatus Onthousia faecigallinarum]
MGRGPMAGTGEKAKDFKGTAKKLLHYLGTYKVSIFFVILFAVVSAVFSIVGPKILGNATTEIFNGLIGKITGASAGIDFSKIAGILLTLLGLYIISMIFSYLQGLIMSGVNQKVAYNLRDQISKKMHRLPLAYFESKTTGEILSRVTNDVDTLSQSLDQSLTQVITSITTLIGVLIMMLTISPLMTLVTFLIVPVALFLMMFIMKHSQKYFMAQQEYLGDINGTIEETYSGHDIVNLFNSQEKVQEKFDKTNEALYRTAWKSQFFSGMMHPIMQFIGNIGYVIVSILGGWLVIQNQIAVGDILSFSQYIRQFMNPLAQIAQVGNLLQSMMAASERVFEFLDEKEEVKDVENVTYDLSKMGNIVNFDHVSFGYNKNRIIIHDFNATMKKGQKIAIVGPTGAGKTTIVKLLMRFYDVDSGSINIDGVNIKDMKRDDLRSLFGMVLQDTWLYSDTIMENIRYGNLKATDEQVEDAAIASHVDHFIRTLPDGYNMVLNEESDNVSQGQKQLLTIARVILKDPKILILDEATSSVDTRMEQLIQQAMDQLMEGRTSFVIAHRLSTIKNANLILVMKDGDIVEQGTHEELLKKNGFYADLYNSQFESISE